MKKILIILLAILCIPISSYAMSLSTLQNNSSRYLRIDDNYETATYLDTYSVKSIRYAPPYYTLSATIYLHIMIFLLIHLFIIMTITTVPKL